MSEKQSITLKINDDPNFTYKVVKEGWATTIYHVDQYGQSTRDAPVYQRMWPTREEAIKDLENVAHEHPYVKGRWVPNEADNGYMEADVRFRSETVNDVEKEHDLSCDLGL